MSSIPEAFAKARWAERELIEEVEGCALPFDYTYFIPKDIPVEGEEEVTSEVR